MLRTLSFISIGLGLLSCSQDVELGHGAGSGGAPSSSSASTPSSVSIGGSSSISTTGAGGTVTACIALNPVGDGVEATGPGSGAATDAPALVSAASGVDLLAEAVPQTNGCDPGTGCAWDLVHAFVSPWDAWPPVVAISTSAIAQGTSSPFAVGVSTDGKGFDVLDDQVLSMNMPTTFTLTLSTFTSMTGAQFGGTDMITSVPLPHAPPIPRFVSNGFAGYDVLSPIASPEPVSLNFLFEGSGFEVGCGSSPPLADAIALPDAFLMAFSSGLDFGGCDGEATAGPPSQVDIVVVDSSKQPAALAQTAVIAASDPSDPVSALRLVPRSDGAWLVWQTEGNGAVTQPAIQFVRVDGAGHMITPVSAIDASNGEAFSSAAALGDGLAVAWVDPSKAPGPTLTIQVVQANGDLGATVTVDVPAGAMKGTALLGAPSGDKLLAAWPNGANLGLRRFDCVIPD